MLVGFYQNDIDFSEQKAAPVQFPGRDLLRRTALFEALEWNWQRRIEEDRGRRGESDLDRQKSEWYRRYVGELAQDPRADDVKRRIVLARELLLEMNAECRRRGIAFAVAILPGFAQTEHPDTNFLSIDIAGNLARAAVRHVDLLPLLAPAHDRIWLPDRGHWTDAGHELVATAVARFLLEHGLVP